MNPKHRRSARPDGGAGIGPFLPAAPSHRLEATRREMVGTLMKAGRSAAIARIGPEWRGAGAACRSKPRSALRFRLRRVRVGRAGRCRHPDPVRDGDGKTGRLRTRHRQP